MINWCIGRIYIMVIINLICNVDFLKLYGDF